MKSHYITLKPHEITIFLVKPPFSHGFLSTCWAIQASPVVSTGPCWAPMAPGGRQRCSPTGRRTWVENGFWALQKCWFHWNWTIVIGVLNQLSYLGGPHIAGKIMDLTWFNQFLLAIKTWFKQGNGDCNMGNVAQTVTSWGLMVIWWEFNII